MANDPAPIDPTAAALDAAEHAFRSYLGGHLRAGVVPFGARILPDALRPAFATRLAALGIAVTFEAHATSDALTVATLAVIPRETEAT